jgi:hypothetical protein
MKNVIKPIDQDGKDVPHMQLVGTHRGILQIGCFGAGIRLDGGVHLAFNSAMDVPKELWPASRGEDVPVEVKVYLDDLERIVYDAEKI